MKNKRFIYLSFICLSLLLTAPLSGHGRHWASHKDQGQQAQHSANRIDVSQLQRVTSEQIQRITQALQGQVPLKIDRKGWKRWLVFGDASKASNRLIRTLAALVMTHLGDLEFAQAVEQYVQSFPPTAGGKRSRASAQMAVAKMRASLLGVPPGTFVRFPGFQQFVAANLITVKAPAFGHQILLDGAGHVPNILVDNKYIPWPSLKKMLNGSLDPTGKLVGYEYTEKGITPLVGTQEPEEPISIPESLTIDEEDQAAHEAEQEWKQIDLEASHVVQSGSCPLNQLAGQLEIYYVYAPPVVIDPRTGNEIYAAKNKYQALKYVESVFKLPPGFVASDALTAYSIGLANISEPINGCEVQQVSLGIVQKDAWEAFLRILDQGWVVGEITPQLPSPQENVRANKESCEQLKRDTASWYIPYQEWPAHGPNVSDAVRAGYPQFIRKTLSLDSNTPLDIGSVSKKARNLGLRYNPDQYADCQEYAGDLEMQVQYAMDLLDIIEAQKAIHPATLEPKTPRSPGDRRPRAPRIGA